MRPQNTSPAVMQQRHEAQDSLDDFPTPPWATRALLRMLRAEGAIPAVSSVVEPACNRGHMVRPLKEAFGAVHASDIHDYGCGFRVADFLDPELLFVADWCITNPPFRLAEEFALKAIRHARQGVALFVRTAFLESVGRHERLFKPNPPWAVAQFTERVVLHKGKLAPGGSTATAYCWVVWTWWHDPEDGTRLLWIPPCRRELERPGDYAE